MNPWIGRFSVKGVQADTKDDFMICKLKARLNLHGILNVEQGYYVEEQEIEEPVPEAKDGDVSTALVLRSAFVSTEEEEAAITLTAAELKNLRLDEDERAAKRLKTEPLLTIRQAMDTDKANGDAPKTRKVKKQVRKGDLPLSAGTASLDQQQKDLLLEKEGQMISEDKLVAETEDRKNELESEIYSLRGKLDEPYASNGYSEFASEDEKAKVKAKCDELEVSCNHSTLSVSLINPERLCSNALRQFHSVSIREAEILRKRLLQTTNMPRRTGYMKTAKTPRRHNTLPNSRSSAPLPHLSSPASTRSVKKKRRHEERSKKRLPPSARPQRTLGELPRPKRRRPRKKQPRQRRKRQRRTRR